MKKITWLPLRVIIKLKSEKFVNLNAFYMVLNKRHNNSNMNSRVNFKVMVFSSPLMVMLACIR